MPPHVLALAAMVLRTASALVSSRMVRANADSVVRSADEAPVKYGSLSAEGVTPAMASRELTKVIGIVISSDPSKLIAVPVKPVPDTLMPRGVANLVALPETLIGHVPDAPFPLFVGTKVL